MPVLAPAVDEVSQGHLLVAGQLVPLSVEVRRSKSNEEVQEVSNKLTAQLHIHRNGV